jgi:hypothetical protein
LLLSLLLLAYLQEYNDSLLVTYLSTITKGAHIMVRACDQSVLLLPLPSLFLFLTPSNQRYSMVMMGMMVVLVLRKVL